MIENNYQAFELATDLVTKWEESLESGHDLTPHEICVDHPELEGLVMEQINKLRRIQWITSNWNSTSPEIPPPRELAIGTLLADRFEIEAVLGSGGYGTVYKALDTALLRPVAVKCAKSRRNIKNNCLLLEARNAAQMTHTNIVRIYDISQHEGQHFIVSELINGNNLQKLTHDKRLPVDQIRSLMLQVADALASAHKSGLVHRDLKPSNILVDGDGQAIVSDFGIAFQCGESHLLETTIGTLAYMSPEQASGEVGLMGPPTDIFSFGVVLYELLMGMHPFWGQTSKETIQRIIGASPAPINGLPKKLSQICEQCLHRRPRDRPTAADVYTRLKEFHATLINSHTPQ